MRLFLAVFPPPAAQAAARAVADALRASGDGVSWVRRENLHYTLRFLGELGVDGARRAGEAARAAVFGHAPFDAELAGAGAFPDAARARVLWLGMGEGAAPLAALARALEAELECRGFGRADQKFTPHLTLGRARAGGDWAAPLATAAVPAIRFRIGEVVLVESTLAPGGSQYRVRERAPLGAAS